MLEELEKLQNEKKVIENKMALRRQRYAEQIEELKNEGKELTDEYLKELDTNFEKGLLQEFDEQLKSVNAKIEKAERKVDLSKKIEEKDKEIKSLNDKIEAKNKELQEAENAINHEIVRQYYSKQGLSETPISRQNIETIQAELNALASAMTGLQGEKRKLEEELEALDPKEQKTEPQGETKPEEARPEEARLEETEPETAMPQGTIIHKEVVMPQETRPEGKIIVEISKKGSRTFLNGKEITTLQDEGLPQNNGDLPTEGYVTNELNRPENRHMLGEKEVGKLQLMYKDALNEQNEQQRAELVDKMKSKLEIKYDLHGLSQSGLNRKARRALIADVKREKDLGVASVKAPWYIKAQWGIKELLNKGMNSAKNLLNRGMNSAKNLLNRGKNTEALTEGPTKQQAGDKTSEFKASVRIEAPAHEGETPAHEGETPVKEEER